MENHDTSQEENDKTNRSIFLKQVHAPGYCFDSVVGFLLKLWSQRGIYCSCCNNGIYSYFNSVSLSSSIFVEYLDVGSFVYLDLIHLD